MAIRLFVWAAVTGLLGACGEKMSIRNIPPDHTVVVIHSWADEAEDHTIFQKCMEEDFRKADMNVAIHHIYMDMLRNSYGESAQQVWDERVKNIRDLNPDIILINDDPAVDLLLTREHPDSVFLTTPVVFAGVNVLRSDSLFKLPLMTGWVANIDLNRNVDMVMKMTGKQNIIVEIDHGGTDDLLREQFQRELNDTSRYVNIKSLGVNHVDEDTLRQRFPGMAAVNLVSCAYPATNRYEWQSDSVGKDVTDYFRYNSIEMNHIQVKCDLFSDGLRARNLRPQYTAIRENFNNPHNIQYLCGYFTGVETQVADQVAYAVRILRGEHPRSLPISFHLNEYFLDWNAVHLVLKPETYSTYSERFHIINAPLYLENPGKFAFYVVIWAVAVGVFIFVLVRVMTHWRKRTQMKLLAELEYEDYIFGLLFSDSKDTVWVFSNGDLEFGEAFAERHGLKSRKLTSEQIRQCVHPSSMAAQHFIENFREQRDRQTVRIQMTFDGGQSYHWFEVVYTATDETAESGFMSGLLINIDDKKRKEEQLEQAQIEASQISLKENFLANISHDLRTPLGAVTGFSTMLAMPGMVFEEGEREQYSEIIHQNTDMILDMIDSVMKKAQIETGDLEIIRKPVSVQKLVRESYNTNNIIAPTHLRFILEMGQPDATVDIDMIRTKQVINNFLSNSFKFTITGSITLGWKYVEEDPEQVEIFVQDTGIGVAPEKQAALFERYVKVDETDKGTGLGLNICKTIVEKQDGTIGVKSELGKGSRFFFRLRRIAQCLALVATVAFGLLVPSSCRNSSMRYRKAKVVIVHSFDKDYSQYRRFHDAIKNTMLDNGIDPSFHIVYLDMANPNNNSDEIVNQLKDSVELHGWTPDLIIAEGDRAAHKFFTWRSELGELPRLDKIPIIFGAVHHPEWDKMRKFRNAVLFSDPIDYVTNINLAVELFGKNMVQIELDYRQMDTVIRKELRTAIARPPYVDNTDFHIADVNEEKLAQVWKDSVLVQTYSIEQPEANMIAGSDIQDGSSTLHSIYAKAWKYPVLIVKKDIYSSILADKTNRPQFSAIKINFGEGQSLCGYFADFETVGNDVAKVGADILRGADPMTFVGLTHQKQYYMDYQAMEKLGLSYNDYKDRFIILGAPMSVKAPLFAYLSWIFIALVFLGSGWAIVMVTRISRERRMQKLMADVQRRAEIRTMSMQGAHSKMIHSEEELDEILNLVPEEFCGNMPMIRQSMDIAGNHSYEIRADVENMGEPSWWQLRFVVVFGTGRNSKHLAGLLVNIDETKRHEEKLRRAMEIAEEVKQKEDFLTIISHEIRTPLNAVVGLSDVLANLPREIFSDEELADISKKIKVSNTSLTAMIEDILMFSRIESGRIQYMKNEFDANELVQEVASEWRDLMPDGVQLDVREIYAHVTINNDRTRLKYMLNQLISNAVKFTKEGFIVVGLVYHMNDDKAEFFVWDSGCGIPKDKFQQIFNVFWKDDGFVPGLGLGLSVAKKMAAGMDLKINVASKVGYGSQFSILSDATLRKLEYAGHRPSL